jgi:hypothetical protein
VSRFLKFPILENFSEFENWRISPPARAGHCAMAGGYMSRERKRRKKSKATEGAWQPRAAPQGVAWVQVLAQWRVGLAAVSRESLFKISHT